VGSNIFPLTIFDLEDSQREQKSRKIALKTAGISSGLIEYEPSSSVIL